MTATTTPNHEAQTSIAEAVGAMKQRNPQQAERVCKDFLVLNPSSIPHVQVLGHALIQMNRLEEARAQIEFGIKLAPDYAAFYEDLGSIAGIEGQYDEAVTLLQRAIQMDPKQPRFHKKLAQALVAAGRANEADEAFMGFLDRDNDAALVAMGAEHWRAERKKEAEEAFRNALRENPQNVNAMRFLAICYHEAGGKIIDAEALLRRAVEIAPDFHQAWHNLGSVLIDSQKWQEAVKAFKELVALKPEDDLAWAGMGNASSNLGDVDAAILAFEQSLSINPQSAGVHMSLAHMYKTVGRLEDALASYRESIRLKPDLGESYWSMANLKIFKFEDEEVAAMEAQLENAELSEQARVHFEFSLGKAYEDRKDYDSAWQHYSAGNQQNRGLVDYDPVEFELLQSRIQSVFSPEFVNQHLGLGHDAPDPIFIVGLPRSGSTLVEQNLSSHSQVEGTSELPNAANIAYSTAKYRSDGLTFPGTLGELTARDWAAYGKEYLQQVKHHRVEGTPLFIDKMPNNFSFVGWIKLILPNAKIINTRRFPLDSLLGAHKQLFAKGQNFTYDEFELAEYYQQYVKIMGHWHQVFPGEVLDVHYEDTVTRLEWQVRRVLEFCGLPFEEQCLRYYENKRAVKTASSEQVRQPIYTSALGLWQRYETNLDLWKDELKDVIEACPESVLDAAGWKMGTGT